LGAVGGRSRRRRRERKKELGGRALLAH